MKIFQINAFVGRGCKGNPAAVIPLDKWINDSLMQEIAEEKNLSETAFFVKNPNDAFEIRWFTPNSEVNLCGHATIATAYVLYEFLGYKKNKITFLSNSGELFVRKLDGMLELDFPISKLEKIPFEADLAKALGEKYYEIYHAGEDILVIFENESQIKNLNPDFNLLKLFEKRGIVASAVANKESEVDFVSRAFFPRLNVNEDPVCGSAHTYLAPYWSDRLNKNNLHSLQLSKRKGELFCFVANNRVLISGRCKLFMKGDIVYEAQLFY